MSNIEQRYQEMCVTPSDINENLSVLKKYAEQSENIVELGVRSIVSTWALLAGKPKSLVSVDIEHPANYGGDLWEVMDACADEGIEFSFIQNSSLEITLPEIDMLFIDTLHTYGQLTAELERHSNKVKKYIAMHDTAIPSLPEMTQAVNDFLDKHGEWRLEEHKSNNNGLTLLQRVK